MKRLFAATSLALMLAPSVALAQIPDSPIILETATGTISGTLILPPLGKKAPVILIIAGSGPTDRDGNSKALPGKNDSLKMLAQALGAAGIPSVRYDKRGIGDSVRTPEENLRFDSYVRDATDWVEMLKRDPRFAGVIVAGHSEGSLIGMLAARAASAKAFVSIAGPARSASQMLRQQLAGTLPADLAARNEAILQALEQAEPVGDIPPQLQSLYRKTVLPYLASWFKYVPADEYKKLDMPTLIIQGDTDIQVGVEQARALKAANPRAELAVIRGMNHVLKQVPPDPARQLSSYGDPALPLSREMVEQLIRFLDSLPAKTMTGGA